MWKNQFFFQFNELLVLFDKNKLNAFSEYLRIILISIAEALTNTPN